MSLKQNKKTLIGPALVGSCLAVVISVPVAAYLGSIFGDSYNMRALIYCGLLFWAVAGAIVIYLITRQAEEKNMSSGYILLWFVSAWLWPLLAVTWYIKKSQHPK